ncbi:hypothetical protein [Streptomyces sp. TP-A0356]|uniref:hypothetical protein n=1 Tax=Streptomyces sp. TP-A0356 TaxID=1359208 RepID=UPI0006E1846D|nr:hypothetical protein [Streptomyces sp. TP-A0356]
MTSATSVTRRQARIALAAAGLTAALVLTGCSSGSGDGGSSAPSASSSSSPAATGDGSGAPSAKPGKLEGSWLATTDGKAVALVITGKQAALFTTGGTVCSGTAGEEAGMEMIHLKCTDGSKNRRTGMVDSVTSAGMKVTWQGGIGAETYTRSEGGKMPSGLPTASLGS